MQQQTIFVFYNPKNIYWNYGNFPLGWWWVGSGSAIGTQYYIKEEQFNGPCENFNEMMQYLKDFFDDLLTKEIVESYCLNKMDGG